MKIKITKSFRDRLTNQIEYIAKDKPLAARNFKKAVLQRINEIPALPYAFRKSIFFEREDIRELIYKGYIIIFKINDGENTIEVFGFTKWEDYPHAG